MGGNFPGSSGWWSPTNAPPSGLWPWITQAKRYQDLFFFCFHLNFSTLLIWLQLQFQQATWIQLNWNNSNLEWSDCLFSLLRTNLRKAFFVNVVHHHNLIVKGDIWSSRAAESKDTGEEFDLCNHHGVNGESASIKWSGATLQTSRMHIK